MTWEVRILVPPEREEALTEFLQEAGSHAVTVEDAGSVPLLTPGGTFQRCRLRGYFDAACQQQAIDTQTRLFLSAMGLPVGPDALQWEKLEEQDWQETWKEHFHAMPVGKRLLVLPTWLEPPPDHGRMLLRIDPQMAFGTGSHETTAGCLAALERRAEVAPLGSVLDLGTGSGILAIAAALLGADAITATDNDPVAVEICQKNCLLNHVDQKVSTRLAEHVPPGFFHTITANILAQPLMDLAPAIVQALHPGGHLILSGLLTDQEEMVRETYQPLGFSAITAWHSGEWVVLTADKESNP